MSSLINRFRTSYTVCVRSESMGCGYTQFHTVPAFTRGMAVKRALMGGGTLVSIEAC